GRVGLARASRTPGRTRALIFFNLAERLVLVDLPGYGYAKAPKSLARQWQGLMLAYLRGRPNLRRIVLLIDARHPVNAIDEAVMALLDNAAVSFQIVLTKSDLVAMEQCLLAADQARALARRHPACHPEILACSSRRGTGIAELRAELAALAR
ncbi:MAG: ribosome biogenesis GTP-binding protein YihA/YsxC, partial [Acetobacteraceae bacterium]